MVAKVVQFSAKVFRRALVCLMCGISHNKRISGECFQEAVFKHDALGCPSLWTGHVEGCPFQTVVEHMVLRVRNMTNP